MEKIRRTAKGTMGIMFFFSASTVLSPAQKSFASVKANENPALVMFKYNRGNEKHTHNHGNKRQNAQSVIRLTAIKICNCLEGEKLAPPYSDFHGLGSVWPSL